MEPDDETFTTDEWVIIHEALVFVRRKPEIQEQFEKFMRRNFRGRASAVATFRDGCTYSGHYLIGMAFRKIQEAEALEDD